jgi:hypothetical protein
MDLTFYEALQRVPEEMSHRALLRNAACALAALLIMGCTSNGGSSTTSSSSATGAPSSTVEQSATPQALTFQTALNLYDVQVPVPSGWTMSGEQSLVSLVPPGGGQELFQLMFVSVPPAVALDGNCGDGTPPQRQGPITLVGHVNSYEFYCPLTNVVQGTWTALFPTAAGNWTWAWDYLGATGLESGPDASTFMSVLQAFPAPNVPTKPP